MHNKQVLLTTELHPSSASNGFFICNSATEDPSLHWGSLFSAITFIYHHAQIKMQVVHVLTLRPMHPCLHLQK